MRIYKDLDFVEQLGSGIPRILAYYGQKSFKFSENFLRMVFPASEKTTEHVTEQVTEQVQQVVETLGDEKLSRNEIMDKFSLKHRPSFLYSYLKPAINIKVVQMTIPDKPKSSKKKYYLTQSGKTLLQKLNKYRKKT